MSRSSARTRAAATAALAVASLLVSAQAAAGTVVAPTSPALSPTAPATPSSTSQATPPSTSQGAATPTADPTSDNATEPTSTVTGTPSSTPSAPAPRPTTATPAAQPALTPLKLGRSASVYGPQAVAGSSAATTPSTVAGGYLARLLAASGGYFSNEFSGTKYPDYGLTLDAVLALDAAGVGQGAARQATSYVAQHVRSYVTGADYGGAGERYAGALAKSLNVSVAQGVDPHAFGGVDLVAELTALMAPTGRFTDVFDPEVSGADYSNTFSQSFAVMGLQRAGAVAPQAVSYLKLQQCPAGGFRLVEADTACTDNSKADPDSTSLAVQALIRVGGSSDPAAVRGLDWLTSQQAVNGGFGGGVSTEALNANSTGLAGQALLAGGRSAPARQAVGYLTALQYGCSFPVALRGGIAYNKAAYAAQKAKKSKATPSDQDRRSTAQAVLALAGTPLGVVTAKGAVSTAPQLSCTTPKPTPTTPPKPTAPKPHLPVPTVPGAVNGGGSAPTQAAGSLPRTGSDLAGPLAAGVLMSLLGAAAVVVTRRRRAAGSC